MGHAQLGGVVDLAGCGGGDDLGAVVLPRVLRLEDRLKRGCAVTEDELNRIADEEAARYEAETRAARRPQQRATAPPPVRSEPSDTVEWMVSEPPQQRDPGQTPTVVHVHMQQSQGVSNGAAAVISLILPGVGQMCQGRIGTGLVWFVLAPFAWVAGAFTCGLAAIVFYVACIVNAATYTPPTRRF